jgi:hypothetical protein
MRPTCQVAVFSTKCSERFFFFWPDFNVEEWWLGTPFFANWPQLRSSKCLDSSCRLKVSVTLVCWGEACPFWKQRHLYHPSKSSEDQKEKVLQWVTERGVSGATLLPLVPGPIQSICWDRAHAMVTDLGQILGNIASSLQGIMSKLVLTGAFIGHATTLSPGTEFCCKIS